MRIGRFERAIMSSAGFRSERSGLELMIFGSSGDSVAYAPASRVVSLCGSSKCTGPGGKAVAVRMARRTCWLTVFASMVVLHLTSGA